MIRKKKRGEKKNQKNCLYLPNRISSCLSYEWVMSLVRQNCVTRVTWYGCISNVIQGGDVSHFDMHTYRDTRQTQLRHNSVLRVTWLRDTPFSLTSDRTIHNTILSSVRHNSVFRKTEWLRQTQFCYGWLCKTQFCLTSDESITFAMHACMSNSHVTRKTQFCLTCDMTIWHAYIPCLTSDRIVSYGVMSYNGVWCVKHTIVSILSYVRQNYVSSTQLCVKHRIMCQAHNCVLRPGWRMGWLRWVGCLKIYVSLQNIGLFCRSLLQKRPIFLSILLIVATP